MNLISKYNIEHTTYNTPVILSIHTDCAKRHDIRINRCIVTGFAKFRYLYCAFLGPGRICKTCCRDQQFVIDVVDDPALCKNCVSVPAEASNNCFTHDRDLSDGRNATGNFQLEAWIQ